MSWLYPLGFLGLLGLIVLILIYIIKPNYQNKIISSTYVWKLSLKYKKNRLPLNKLRNILLLLCQIFAIIVASLLLAQPFISEEAEPISSKKVFIIDASASMMAKTEEQSRFELAVLDIQEEIEATFKLENSEVSVIVANDTASFVVQKATEYSKGEVFTALNDLIDPTQESVCTYASPDIAGAIKLSEKITAVTPDVEVLLYTDMEYIDAGNVTVKNMKGELDWNAAVLDARMILFDNRYTVEVDVACYGMNKIIPVYCIIDGVDNSGNDVNFEIVSSIQCRDGETATLEIAPTEENQKLRDLASYRTLTVSLDEDDVLDLDNSFQLFGGEKLPLKIQYCSPNPNNYFSTAFRIIREKLKYRWDIDFDEVVVVADQENPDMELEGYDIYIFETVMPQTLPTDGISILVNPTSAPLDAGFKVGMERYARTDTYLTAGEEHRITRGVSPEEILVTKYSEILNPDASYVPLLYYESEPMLLVKNKEEADQKVVVLPFSLNYSNLPVVLDFPLMMYNIVEYYLPSTITNYVYDVNESIELNARGEELTIQNAQGMNAVLTEFPNVIELTTPGVYEVTQTNLAGDLISESFYVKIPDEESNTNPVFDTLENPYFMVVEKEEVQNKDILLYFAIALVALLFAEWWLHTREQY